MTESVTERAALVPAELPGRAQVSFPVRRLRLFAVAALIIAGISVWGWRQLRSRSSIPAVSAVRSLAVLPFENMSGDPSQEYFADGMTEELIGRLANIHGLRVISRTSAMHFKHTQLRVPEIAKILGVDAIVEGSVLKEGGRVRFYAQLIRATSEEHIWAGEYLRENRDLLALQEEVARNIAERIEIGLTSNELLALASAHPVDLKLTRIT